MAPHSCTLAWKLPWMEEPGRLQSMGSLRVRYDWATSLSLSCIGEGNGNPLQCSSIPGMGEPGGLLSMGSHRVGHNWSDLAARRYFESCQLFFFFNKRKRASFIYYNILISKASESLSVSCSVVSDSANPMDCSSPGRASSHSLLWGIFLTQGLTWVSRIAGRFFTV